jgi:glutamate--cysteine ligase
VSDQLTKTLQMLQNLKEIRCLEGITHGIEKESLRISPNGHISLTPHPKGLGSPLTHELVTTDFSEALIEFITPTFQNPETSLAYLHDIHRFVYSQLPADELLWTSSMPCIIHDDEQIPLAQYGSSNIGKLKTLYRRGLGHRYSRAMQTIAGIHFNFSLPDDFWFLYQDIMASTESLQDFKTQQYFHLIRNFRRYSWLLIYLFGASPAVCKSFLKNKIQHDLVPFDKFTFHMPYGTSLRMGDLGYTSAAQSSLVISYNSLEEYVAGLRKAINTPYPPYEAFAQKGEGHQQINSNILQIENEFYTTIRPKRVSRKGERPIQSLIEGGVEYIEVRCFDLNPFLPMGINETQIQFMNAFLIFCLLRKSPLSSESEYREIQENFSAAVILGRKPDLQLQQNGSSIFMREWANEILMETRAVAELLDRNMPRSSYLAAVAEQLAKVDDSELTPSAQVLAQMKKHQQPYFDFAMDFSLQHAKLFAKKLSTDKLATFKSLSEKSRQELEEIENSDSMDFDSFLVHANRS